MLGGRTRAGFTLTELLVVIACIALLAAVLLPAASRMRESARDSKAKSEMAQIASAIEQFKTDNGHYPRVEYKWIDQPSGNIPVASPPGSWQSIQGNNMRLFFLLAGATVPETAKENIYWDKPLYNENFLGNAGSYLPRSMLTPLAEASEQWKKEFSDFDMNPRSDIPLSSDYQKPTNTWPALPLSYVLLDPWGQPYLYFWQRNDFYKCDPGCFASTSARGNSWNCGHRIAEDTAYPQNVQHAKNGYGRPVDAPQPATGYEYAFELWSAGRDKMVTCGLLGPDADSRSGSLNYTDDLRKKLRASGVDRDNITGVSY